MRIREMAGAAVLALAVAAHASAQSAAVLKGTVHEPSGAPMADVVITVMHPRQEHVRVVMTDLRGEYAVEGLEPGTEYRVDASHPKYRKATVKARLSDDEAPVAITLKPRRACLTGRR